MKHNLNLFDIEQEAIEYIQENAPKGEPYFVGFSGGKDSIVVYDLVKRSGVRYQSYYNFTTIDPPELTRFIKKEYPEVKWLMPEMNFWDLCRKKNRMPTRKARFCCDVLKHNGKGLREIGLHHHVLGLRAEESAKRRERPRTEQKNGTKRNPVWMYKPIFGWASDEIWNYIHDRGLKYPALYDEGFHRLGCVVCPFVARERSLGVHKKRWPNHYKILDRLLAETWEKNRAALLDLGFSEERYKAWPQWDK